MEARYERAHECQQRRAHTWGCDRRMASVLVNASCTKVAQPVVDFVFWMHFIKPIYVIEPFEIERAAILLIVTASVGFLIGSIFALLWNALHKS